MIQSDFKYMPGEHEAEKASNSYLMSLIFLMAGLPLPIINFIGTSIFFLANRKGTYFVRWHCTQALFSQLIVLPFNSIGFWWTIHVIFHFEEISNQYIAYILTIIIFNITEFVVTIHTAIQTRKGIHISWWFFGELTNLICKKEV